MKKTWIVPCCALGMLLYAGTAQAAFWQVLRDTPVRADASDDAKVLGTAQKGWIVSDMTGDGSSPQWIRMVEFQTKAGEGMACPLHVQSPECLHQRRGRGAGG